MMSDRNFKGFVDFVVFDTVTEDDFVKSLYLKRKDGQNLPKALPGQFISVRIPISKEKYSKARQYTLSMDTEEDYYRISVKAEEYGELSKPLCREIKIGDTLQCTAPAGKFVLKESGEPLVLIGGGIGITPMLCMAYAAKKQNRDVNLIYSTQNSNNHSFKEELYKLSKESSNINFILVYTRPLETDTFGVDFDVKGRINKEWMEKNLPKDADFYFCGPVEFMKSIYKNLISMGVQESKINYEMFAPGVDITK